MYLKKMSKAEEKAKEAYPLKDAEHVYDEERVIEAREHFVQGYHQTEEDLKLTWEDIANILDVTDVIANDDSMEERLKTMSEEEYCQEVLKRFNEHKQKR